MAAWSSLPHDVVGVIANLVLDDVAAAGDLDYYMNMRSVCHNWRFAIVDPRAQPADPRFRLRQWVMLDEKHPNRGDALGRVFLNTVTGRYVNIELTSLLDYYFITSMGGLIVVASRATPHVVSVFNPFAGSFMAFMAPIPESVQHTTAYLHQVGPLPPTLVLEIGESRDTAYSAQPNAEQFAVVEHGLLDKGRNVWGIAGDQHEIDDLMSSVVAVLPDEIDYYYVYPCCYFVRSPGGDNLLVVRRQRPAHGVDVFKLDAETMAIQPTTCIGSRALFLGDRCVSVDVDADKFDSIHGNCIFYHDGHRDGEVAGVYMYDLTNQTEEWVAPLFSDEPWDSIGIFPSSMIQLLMNYCTNIKWTQLDVERRQAMYW
ncbi:unnamed protein product [Alopecurus aequalis]